MTSHTIEELQKEENANYTWAIESLGESVAHSKAMSTYYPSIFLAINTIFDSATNTKIAINEYDSYLNQSQSYSERSQTIRSLAVTNIPWYFLAMAISGVVVPMGWVAFSNVIDEKRKLHSKKFSHGYFIVIAVSIILFTLFTLLVIFVLYDQIYSLFTSNF